MRAVLLLVAGLALSGCMSILCGPPNYFVSSVGLQVEFDEPWNTTQAAAGIRAAGFTPREPTERVVDGRNETRSIYVNGGPPSPTTFMSISIETEARSGMTAEEAEEYEAALIAEHGPAMRTMLADFEAGSTWTADKGPTMRAATGHGDC